MSLLKVGSDNPNFSFVISKNPATIRDSNTPFKRSVRKGMAYGWFSNETDTQFTLWFKDQPTKSSFAEGRSEEFEYLDCSRYGSPYAPIAMITECLASAAKEEHEQDREDMGYTSYASAIILVASPSFLTKMATSFEGPRRKIVWNFLPNQTWYAKVMVLAPTLREALNVLQSICILQVLSDDGTYVPLNAAALLKYASVFNRANAPYYPRYLFKMKAINNYETFDKIKGDLNGPGMSLVYGDTRRQRYDAIRNVLGENTAKTLYDIGCGEMFYALRLNKIYETVFAIDANEEQALNNQGKIRGQQVENVEALHAYVNADWVADNGPSLEDADVLMTEIIEHVDKKEAENTIGEILAAKPARVVITVPNKSFNVHYGLSDDETRHPEHLWEPTLQEFQDMMTDLAHDYGYSLAVGPIGDVVNNESVTSMAVFMKG